MIFMIFMLGTRDIIKAYDVNSVSENYSGEIEITDLKQELGTKGHLLVVRGDNAYSDELGENKDLANPKFWLYENLINSPRVQEQLRRHPNYKLFDGVGFSSLEALGFHTNRIGRKAVVVMAHEHVPDDEVIDRYGIEVIHGYRPAEEGYVKKQREVLAQRDDLIPLHQALYGAQALAPVGNTIVNRLEELCIVPDETYWCMASGSNLYGIGAKMKSIFGSKIVLVEPKLDRTIDPSLDLSDSEAIRSFAKRELRNYSLDDLDRITSGVFPLHGEHPNKYLLFNWLISGETGFDSTIGVSSGEVNKIQKRLKNLNSDYDWTKTTALTMVPAIKAAKEGKNILVMSYGKNRAHKFRDLNLVEEVPWILRYETPFQKATALTVGLGWSTAGLFYALNVDPNAPPLSFM